MHDANAADAQAIGLSGPATDGRSVFPDVVSAKTLALSWRRPHDEYEPPKEPA